jgi:hypothetical protein
MPFVQAQVTAAAESSVVELSPLIGLCACGPRRGTDDAPALSELDVRLQRFANEHPGCVVVRPDPAPSASVLTLLSAGIAASIWIALCEGERGAIGWTALALAALLLQLLPWWRWADRLRRVLELRRLERACFAFDDRDLLLIDGVGNTVVVALDRITALEIDGDEVRLRTDADEQGIIYAVLFQLFDESVPGPSAERFFAALAPRLRESCPLARVVRREANLGALTTGP